MSRLIRLLIVDTHLMFRECLAISLADADPTMSIELAYSSEEALQKVSEWQPDIALVNFKMRGGVGLELAKKIAVEFPGTKVLALEVAEAVEPIMKCAEVGIAGFLIEGHSSLAELKNAIERIICGEEVCSPEINYMMFSRLNEIASERWWAERIETMILTTREVEILELIAKGLSNKEIADKLFLSLHTVKNHVHKVLMKLKVKCRTEAVRYAEEQRWLVRSA